MRPFVPYPKIVDNITAWNADEQDRRMLDKQLWIASEKIHGANLCICTDGNAISIAKRRGVIAPEDVFFGYRRAIAPLVTALRSLVRLYPNPAWLMIYGELFGGCYAHPSVAAVQGMEAVQTAIHYCPEVRFFAFDLAMVDDEGAGHFVSFRHAIELFETAGIPVVPTLKIGRLDEVLGLPVEFATRVPAQLGLPEITNNLAEGMVIKPWDLDTPLSARRYALKRKRPAFAETREVLTPVSRTAATLSGGDVLAGAEAAISAMLTDHRIHSAMTKLGRPHVDGASSSVEALAAEVVTDLRDELDRTHGDLVLALDPDDAMLLWSVVLDDVIALVSDFLHGVSTIDPDSYFADLAWAFLRGRLPGYDEGATLLDAARAAGLRWHKFKRKSGPPRITQVLAILDGLAPRSLLDIGSGRGAFLWPLLARFNELPVTAVDRLQHRVADIEAVHAGGIERVHAQVGDVTELPFGDAAFDIVTILEVLEHLEAPAAAAREVLRVASRYVIASVPSHEDDNPEHIRLFTRNSLTELFKAAGAERVQVTYVLNHMIAVVAKPGRPAR